MPQDPRTYSPTPQEANRAREQGGGVGQRDLSTQRDPSRADIATSSERTEPFDTEMQAGVRGEDRPFAETTADGEEGDDPERRTAAAVDTEPDPRFVGVPANVDPDSLEDGHGPEMDWGDPEPDAVHGATHTRRPVKTEAERGQGPKTRSRNKQIVSGRPYG